MITNLKSLGRSERWFLVGLIIFSLGLRLTYLAEMSHTLFLTQLRLDELFHNNWAKSIASGNIIGDQVFFRAPLYAYWLGSIFALFGHSYIIPRLVQHILGTLSIVILYFLARKLYGKKVAVISSILMSTYAVIIYQEDKFLFESILLFLLLIFFTLLSFVKEHPSFMRWGVIGILWGLICITRPIFLPYFTILGITIFIWYRNLYPAKKSLIWIGSFLLGMILTIAPITVRNYLIGNDIVLIANQGGINFYLGNNASADGFSSTMPGIAGNRWEKRDIEFPIIQETGRAPTYSEVDRYWFNRGLHFIFSQPWDYFKLTLKKVYLFWNALEIPNNNSFYLYRQFSEILTWLPTGFWLVGPLGILGMIFAWRERQGRHLIIFVFIYMITVISFFVCDRFRLPVVPVLCIMSGLAVVRFWEHRKQLASEFGLKYVSLLVTAFIIINSNIFNFHRGNPASDYFHLGNMELSAGNNATAAGYYRRVVATTASIQDTHLNWGIAEWKQGNIKEAISQFQLELTEYPNSYDAYANLAHLYNLLNQPDRSLIYAQKAIAIKPYASPAIVDMAFAFTDLQKYAAAESVLATFISNHASDGLYEISVLAGIHLIQKKLDIAEQEYRSVLRMVNSNVIFPRK